MSYIQRKTNSKGEAVYKINVSCGYDIFDKQITHTLTYKPEKGMTENQIQKELKRQAVLFEENIKSKKIAIRKVKFADIANEWLTYEEKIGKLKLSTIELYK